jgi:hypothetical protein
VASGTYQLRDLTGRNDAKGSILGGRGVWVRARGNRGGGAGAGDGDGYVYGRDDEYVNGKGRVLASRGRGVLHGVHHGPDDDRSGGSACGNQVDKHVDDHVIEQRDAGYV